MGACKTWAFSTFVQGYCCMELQVGMLQIQLSLCQLRRAVEERGCFLDSSNNTASVQRKHSYLICGGRYITSKSLWPMCFCHRCFFIIIRSAEFYGHGALQLTSGSHIQWN